MSKHKQMPNSLAPTDCPCCTCLRDAGVEVRWMVVCDECGNKRCPAAMDHRNVCTGSNDVGQVATRRPEAPVSPSPGPAALDDTRS